jgi:peptidyl-prolyl cis-trans isomerase C
MLVEARHILVESQEQAQSLLEQIRAGADFAALARQHSQCPSKANGGGLGQFGPGRMVKSVEEATFALSIGDVSEPVQTQFGYHLIQRTG